MPYIVMPPSPMPEPLDDLQKELYAREESPELKARADEIAQRRFRVVTPVKPANPDAVTERSFENVELKRAQKRRRLVWYALAAIVVLGVLAGMFGAWQWYRQSKNVQQSQIDVAIEGPKEVTAGEEVSYTITYKNNSRVAWNQAQVHLTPGNGFEFTKSDPPLFNEGKQLGLSVSSLAPGQSGTIHFTGRLLGQQNDASLLSAELVFVPSNFPSGHFSKTTVFTSTIVALPLDVAIDAAKDAAAGERIRATIQVRNTGTTTLQNTYIALKGSDSTQLATDDPEFSPGFSTTDSRWVIATLDPLQTVTETVVLYVTGRPGEQRTVDIETGVVNGDTSYTMRKLSHVITLATSELTVQQVYNGKQGTIVVSAGDQVSAKVQYKSTGGLSFKNAIITLHLDGTGVDPSSLSLPSGSYNPTTNTITWSAATVPELKLIQPQQSGEIPFSFAMLPTAKFPSDSSDAQNFAVVATATIDSPDLPTPVGQVKQVVSDRAVLSVATGIPLVVDAFYDDGRLGLKSSGPLPPKVGEQTLYTIRARTGSTLNQLGDARVVLVLPDGVKYTNQTYMTAGTVQFNDRTGEVTWSLPLISAGIGRMAPPEEFDFQVAITPGEDKRNKEVSFLNKAFSDGTDQFTDTLVSTNLTQFPSTRTADPQNGTVH